MPCDCSFTKADSQRCWMKHENNQKPSASSIKIEFPLIKPRCAKRSFDLLVSLKFPYIRIFEIYSLGSLNSVKDLLFSE